MIRGWRARRGDEAGFTLVELLITIVLMGILLSAVTMVFMQTTDTVAIAESRTTIYTNARYALDALENDLLSCITFDTGMQAFALENGGVVTSGSFPVYGVTGRHVVGAADLIEFIATTTVGDTLQTAKVTYELIPSNFTISVGGGATSGDQSHKETVRTKRGLYTLLRRVRVANPNVPITPGVPPKYDQVPQDRLGNPIADQELCHYVISFNLEYYDETHKFSQLDPSPFTRKLGGASDPLGNAQGINDTNPPPPAVPTALRVPYVRVTLVVVEDAAERQERTIQKVMWVPMG
jgi:prepilin-type N-terminal cleavage/methylation domain-containing protein